MNSSSTLDLPEIPHEEIGAGTPKRRSATFNSSMVNRALIDSVVKLSPRHMAKNPVMFVVEIGSLLTTFYLIRDFSSSTSSENVFALGVVVWLWFTVLFANFAEAVAEGRGKAQADSLRKTRAETVAYVQRGDDVVEVPSSQLQLGDLCVVTPGQLIPGDGDIVEGIATVDESAITGESAPVVRESGGDRSSVTGGTRVLSDRIVVKITSRPGETFLDRMIALVEGASRQKTPNEIALDILLAGLTIVFMFTVVSLQPFSIYSGAPAVDHRPRGAARLPDPHHHRRPALGHRDRRHGPPGAAQRPGHVGPGRRSRGRRLDAAPRQDGHDHLRQPAGGRLRSHARSGAGRTGQCRHALEPGRRDPGGPVHRGTGRVPLRPGGHRGRGSRARPLHRPDTHERSGRRRSVRSARVQPTRCAGGWRTRAEPRRQICHPWSRPSPRVAALPSWWPTGPACSGSST